MASNKNGSSCREGEGYRLINLSRKRPLSVQMQREQQKAKNEERHGEGERHMQI